ncbi:CGNR zinc finger domain-containing protein [Nocardia mexicana]|uniref:Putative RNA-binding Zn ribbon-like protein n=1 Tax=Nocardia mexicana TaxID=279262 RepID=A0A370H0I4_9NOCA|nr:CGNR zinc finger domain-containing protein [Nocardia mexicana]RDI49411.1 putative RNA-binding Zn ribbon-like protein [Nocardia mexicana]
MHPKDPSTAPLPLRWVEDLINTRSLVYGTDDLADAGALRRWLAERDLPAGDRPVRDADLRRAVRLREGLRALLISREDPDVDVGDLDDLARDLPLVVQSVTGAPQVVPRARESADAALARLLAIVAAASADGTWGRLKACRNPDCRWAYYDHSRNRSRTWCSMETCGNQAKVRAFRRRS